MLLIHSLKLLISDRLAAYGVKVVADTDLMLKNWQSGEIRDVHLGRFFALRVTVALKD